MAFDSTRNGPAPRRSSLTAQPEAPRPRSELWHALRDEGIHWEGQVLLVGAGLDIPALLVLTASRFLLLANGEVALDAPRAWLRPEPKLLDANGVRISITPQGEPGHRGEADRLTIRVRDGRGPAARLVSTITGRIVSPRPERGARSSEPAAAWGGAVGASMPMALPPLPDFDEELPARARASWPPVEQHAVPAPQPRDRTPSVAAWSAANLPDRTEAQPARAATHAVTTVETSGATPADDHRTFNRGLVWGLRSLILALLIGTGLYFGRDSLPANMHFELPAAVQDRFGLDDDDQPTDVSQLPAGSQQTGSEDDTLTPTATQADSDGTNGPPNTDTISTANSEESDDPGLGGDNGDEITPVDPGIGTYAQPTVEPAQDEPQVTAPEVTPTEAPAPTQAPAPTREPTAEPTQAPEPTAEPTQAPAPTEEPTAEPATEAPTDEPATEEPATEAPATEVPTDEPATEAPATEAPATEAPATEVPGRQDPTETPVATVEPTAAPATEEPVATLESQPPSVPEGSTPEQSLASGAFRYTVTAASRGETIEALPDLQAANNGEWVVLSMYGENWSDTEQVFDMSQFQLFADGEEVQLDVGNGWIGGLLGFTPAYGNTDAILWAAHEGHSFALAFLAPAGAEELTLVAGDQVIDLSAALADPAPLGPEAEAPAQPEYIEATVVEVVDAETIVIEQDGVQQRVRYLGIDVPTGDACFAGEATEANRALVEGQVVRIERQATDVDARGNWVRDVWVADDEGRYQLVSVALVSQGAATAGISEPNTRYAGWLQGAEASAEAEGAGLWAACGDDAATDAHSPLQAVAPASTRLTYQRRQRG